MENRNRERKAKKKKKSEGRLKTAQKHLRRKQLTVLHCELRISAAEASSFG